MKIPFEIRRYEGKNVIFINNQLFDWSIEDEAIEKINKIKDKAELKEINNNIRMFLLDCLESYINKKINIRDVLEALRLGYIEIDNINNESIEINNQSKSLVVKQNYSSVPKVVSEEK